jgi:DNA-nicking Smr family endonuclease
VSRRSLDEQLGAVKSTLTKRLLEAAAQRLREAEAAQRERAEREQFARAVGAVQKVKDTGRKTASTLSDELDVSTLLDTDAALAFRRESIGADVLPRLRRGHWSVQRHLDLHGMTREVAREALAQFIRQAERDGLRCVRIVHGKGNGSPGREPVLKAKVRGWLVQKDAVIAFAQAAPHDGGHGAVLVLLRG